MLASEEEAFLVDLLKIYGDRGYHVEVLILRLLVKDYKKINNPWKRKIFEELSDEDYAVIG